MSYYKNIYNQNKNTNRIIIDIALDDYFDFYHEWDNVKFKKRDINPEMAHFLHTCVKQIPSKESLELKFHIENGIKDPKAEAEIRESFNHYYSMEINAVKKDVRNIYKAAAASVIVSLSMLIFVYFAEDDLGEGLLAYTIVNGFEIGVWVFMWQAFYGIVFDRSVEKKRMKEYKRLLDADISFTYESKK